MLVQCTHPLGSYIWGINISVRKHNFITVHSQKVNTQLLIYTCNWPAEQLVVLYLLCHLMLLQLSLVALLLSVHQLAMESTVKTNVPRVQSNKQHSLYYKINFTTQKLVPGYITTLKWYFCSRSFFQLFPEGVDKSPCLKFVTTVMMLNMHVQNATACRGGVPSG